MKKTMLVLCLFVSGQAQVYATNEKPAYINTAVGEMQQETMIYYAMADTQTAGASKSGAQQGLVKAGLDKEAGRVDWGTAMIVLGVAFLVYLINRKKKQDIE